MNGSIRKRGNTWQIRAYLGRDEKGQHRYGARTVKGTKRDAQRELASFLHSVNSGTHAETKRLTVGEYLDGWLVDYARVHVSPTTYQRYEQIVNQHLIPALGRFVLSKITPAAIKHYYAKALKSGRRDGRRGGLSGTSLLQHHRILREALQHAVHENLLVVNPASRVPAPKKADRQFQPLSETQVMKLLDGANGTRLCIPVFLAVLTGLRRGEVLGLRWRDVDIERATATVQQTLEETREGLRFKPPKTQRSNRRLDLLPIAVAALRKHRAEQAEVRLRLGTAWRDHDLVCPGPDGAPWRPNSFSPAFRKLARELDLPITFHGLRHVHASLLLREGIHPKIVSERLGHSSVSLTFDTYAHLMPTMQREAANQLNTSLTQAIAQFQQSEYGQSMDKPAKTENPS